MSKHHWECTQIICPLSYPLRSLILGKKGNENDRVILYYHHGECIKISRPLYYPERFIIFVSKRGHLYNRLLYNSERMSEYEVVHFLQNSDSMLQNPDSFEPEELAQYFASYASYGVHDSITTLL